ncbi:unnamed protein product [Rotaria magnacalcarata]|uniref:Innexin n=4 Tax=Rotaria magnacalcarata TaxID=392030 RepID=A0A816GU04_9BILA|nr:unnamed protein product [Rotaria magnacalcarata]CAF1679529.1 unnamed protein product [Rotaria magnacalcarata]CAF1976290.1 unnamed protein product [Rotaria magnacalcarata]CAF2079198.1 unnamed protein product [Rotaria magnacalcarata]CAF2108160.1 unnamed protein product [Rotaria magnacalcarata]
MAFLLLKGIPSLAGQNQAPQADPDDFVDRLNYRYTVILLNVFSAIVTNRQFSSKQIQCWVPAMFTSGYEDYTNHICYITNTYYVNQTQKIPSTRTERQSLQLLYYQWIPFILCFLSILFYIPNLIWQSLMTRSGLDLKDIIEAGKSYKSIDRMDKRRKIMDYIIASIDEFIDDPRRGRENRNLSILRRIQAVFCCMYGKFQGNYFMMVYLLTKVLYVVNSIGQLTLFNEMLGIKYYRYGLELIQKLILLIQNQPLQQSYHHQGGLSKYFPKVTLCDFEVREPNHLFNSHRYTVECVLPNNLLFEQLFTFLFFWYTMIFILNLVSLFTWSYSFIRPVRIKYVTTRLKLILIRHLRKGLLANENNASPSQQIISNDSLLHRDESHADFARNYLKCDGIFVLRLLETNTSDFVVTHVIEELFYSYEKKASQPVVLDGLAKMMSTLGPDQGLLSLGKLLFLPVMSDPKIAASFGGAFNITDNNNKMLLPSLTTTTDDPLRNAPKLLVPPTPTRRRSSTATLSSQRSLTGSITEQADTTRRTSFLSESSAAAKPSVNEITEILRERRQKIKRKKR